ncbi:hypothetical protein FACS1894132_06940 [Clostridia bacterium]|nr:hypothetical protein FACS1894132_06940 [Clostridia bacterium]
MLAVYQYVERVKKATDYKPDAFTVERLFDAQNPDTKDFLPVGVALGISIYNANEFKVKLRGLSTRYGNSVDSDKNLLNFWETNGQNQLSINPNKIPEDVVLAWRERLIHEGKITLLEPNSADLNYAEKVVTYDTLYGNFQEEQENISADGVQESQKIPETHTEPKEKYRLSPRKYMRKYL